MGEACGTYVNGVFRKGDVRISDLAGRKRLPIGDDSFATVLSESVFVDKSMLVADVLDGDSKVTLFCRPRRFGKSLNLDMMQCFFEYPSASDPAAIDTTPLFEGLGVWHANGGKYRAHHRAYPVVRLSFGDAKQGDWAGLQNAIAYNIASEYARHDYLRESPRLSRAEREAFSRIADSPGSHDGFGVFAHSLRQLSEFLFKHHGKRVAILIDEYDAPAMAGYTSGCYEQVVELWKTLLTGALKSNDALAFAVLTGVQRISKESIFSDLNNLTVNTSLNVVSDERYGFTQAEVEALAEYLGKSPGVEEARRWYDGYRFGTVDVYNPWSALNYFSNDCAVDIYWGNTSSNAVLGDLVAGADNRTWRRLYRLMEPGGTVEAPLDLGVVFPDAGVRPGAVWSMLYLAGYLTTEDVASPNNTSILRRLRIPNREIAELYRSEIIGRFSQVAGDRDRLTDLHRALLSGDAQAVAAELEEILLASASYFDPTCENSYHMLVLGLLFGIPGYADPLSNREAGRGRFDIALEPERPGAGPAVTIELKCVKNQAAGTYDSTVGAGGYDAPIDAGRCGVATRRGLDEALAEAAQEALAQIAERSYDSGTSAGALRYGMAFSGKRLAVAAEVIE